MKKYFLLIFILSSFPFQLYSQDSWIRIYQNPSRSIDNFKKVHISEYENLIFIQHEFEFYSTNSLNGEILKYIKNQNIWVKPFHNFLTHSCNEIEFKCTAVSFFMTSYTDTNHILKYHESSWSVDPDARTYISADAGLSNFQISYFSCGGWLFYPYGGDISHFDNSIWYYGYPAMSNNFTPTIYKSTNNGANWFEISEVPNLRHAGPSNFFQPLNGGFIRINPFNSNYIFAVHRDYMMLSTNGGYNFSSINIPPLKELSFDYIENIIYGVTQNKIYKSFDSGITWDSSNVLFQLNTLEVSPDDNNIIYAGAQNGLYRSTNKGNSWYLYNNSFTPSKNIIGLSKEESTGDTIIVCTKDAVYKVFRDFLVGSSNINNFFAESYKLEQNYPNPFNPNTIINYSIKKSSFVTLKIYDVLGNEITTLVNKEHKAGSYSVNFDGSNLSGGIYFYKLQAGAFIATKKMIFTK